MARRQIFDRDPDPLVLLDELYHAAERDPKGLPLGDVAGHAQRRLTASYTVLGICRLLLELGRLDAAATFDRRGARHQDKQTQAEFPAAHIIPCEIFVTQPGTPPGYLADLFRNPYNRSWVRRNVFAPTDRVHVLVNRADSQCEEGPHGMAQALVRACRLTVSAVGTTDAAFATLTTDYGRAAQLALARLDQQLTPSERATIGRSPITDASGRPLRERPADTRLGSPDAEARAENKGALRQVLEVYARAQPDGVAIGRAAAHLSGLRHNESQS